VAAHAAVDEDHLVVEDDKKLEEAKAEKKRSA
jgi:hypothetical protein